MKKGNGIENFMILTIFIYFETNEFYFLVSFWSIWLKSSEADNVRTPATVKFQCNYFSQLLLSAQALSYIRIWGMYIANAWGGKIFGFCIKLSKHLKRINSFEVYLMWIRNSTASMYCNKQFVKELLIQTIWRKFESFIHSQRKRKLKSLKKFF